MDISSGGSRIDLSYGKMARRLLQTKAAKKRRAAYRRRKNRKTVTRTSARGAGFWDDIGGFGARVVGNIMDMAPIAAKLAPMLL